jgi:hypothetical protein
LCGFDGFIQFVQDLQKTSVQPFDNRTADLQFDTLDQGVAEAVRPSVEGTEEPTEIRQTRASRGPDGGQLRRIQIGHRDGDRESADEFADAGNRNGDALSEFDGSVELDAIPLRRVACGLVDNVDKLIQFGASLRRLQTRIGEAGAH